MLNNEGHRNCIRSRYNSMIFVNVKAIIKAKDYYENLTISVYPQRNKM